MRQYIRHIVRHPVQLCCGRNRSAIRSFDAQPGTAGPCIRRPRRFRADAIVTQESDATAVPLDDGRSYGFIQREARAGMRDAEPIEFRDGIGDAFRTAVGDMVACETEHVETGRPDRSKVFGRCAGCRNVAGRVPSRDGCAAPRDGRSPGPKPGRPERCPKANSWRPVRREPDRQPG